MLVTGKAILYIIEQIAELLSCYWKLKVGSVTKSQSWLLLKADPMSESNIRLQT